MHLILYCHCLGLVISPCSSYPVSSGSEVVVKTLTETTEQLGLGKLMVELDAVKTVQLYSEHIE